MENTLLIAAAVAATFVLAGVVKGVIGLGLPTICMGLLGQIMSPAEAAALLVVPSLATNVWQMGGGPRLGALLLRFWPLLAGICAGTWGGAGLLDDLSAAEATRLLGVALMLYAGVGLAQVRFAVPARLEPWLALPVGAATGVLTGATGVFVIPAVPFLQALELERDDLLRALGLSFTVSTLALAASLVRMQAFSFQIGIYSLLALLPAILGMVAGQWLRGRLSATAFRRCFFLSLLALGLRLAV